MKKNTVLATYVAPPAPIYMAGVNALHEANTLRTVHHVIHPSSGFKVWVKDGDEEGRVTFDNAEEEGILVRRTRTLAPPFTRANAPAA